VKYVGIDVHKKMCQAAVLEEDGELLDQIRFADLTWNCPGPLASKAFSMEVLSGDAPHSMVVMNLSKMVIAWIWLYPEEIWAKCPECGAWKIINVRIDKFNPEKEPYKIKCPRSECRYDMIIDRKWFSKKNMKRPKREG